MGRSSLFFNRRSSFPRRRCSKDLLIQITKNKREVFLERSVIEYSVADLYCRAGKGAKELPGGFHNFSGLGADFKKLEYCVLFGLSDDDTGVLLAYEIRQNIYS